jgi:hypothetical protein
MDRIIVGSSESVVMAVRTSCGIDGVGNGVPSARLGC